ncbi:hypothetical protein [Microcystis phage Mel-JY01]
MEFSMAPSTNVSVFGGKNRVIEKNTGSKFWMPKFLSDFSNENESISKGINNTFKLAQYQRALTNFVHIMTKQSDIRVKYNTQGQNSTDGNVVYLCPDLLDNEFDVAVGLALHEASHILHSDMFFIHYHSANFKQDESISSIQHHFKRAYLEYLYKKNIIPSSDSYSMAFITHIKREIRLCKPELYQINSEYYSRAGVEDYSNMDNIVKLHIDIRKNIWNVIEDLYIDSTSYNNAPGYRDYYLALYNRYFNHPKIVEAFNSKDMMTPTFDNYSFHICNMRNPGRNLNALPNLKKIFKIMNLKKIHTVKRPIDRFKIADDIFQIVLKAVDKSQDWQKLNDMINELIKEMKKVTDVSKLNEEELKQLAESIAEQIKNGNTSNSPGGIPIHVSVLGGDDDDDSIDGGESDVPEDQKENLDKLSEYINNILKANNLSDDDKSELDKIKKEQEKIRNHEIKKGSISESQQQDVDGACTVDIETKIVGKDVIAKQNRRSNNNKFKVAGINCNIINNITDEFMNTVGRQYGFGSTHDAEYIDRGIRNGNILARKIQLRNEERSLKTSRLRNGRIDTRLLHEIGALKNESVFHKIIIDKYEPTFIHISIDQSGSMSGVRWNNSLEMAAMIATAAKKINNLHVIVSTRSCASSLPYIMHIFDSEKDSIHRLRKVFKSLSTVGSTPEGLCFEAIMKETFRNSRNRISYFINICDGEPYFSYSGDGESIRYSGEDAYSHTFNMMQKMENNGIKFMAYYIGECSSNERRDFIKCFGKNSEFISDPTNITQIAKTMNKKLLENTAL